MKQKVISLLFILIPLSISLTPIEEIQRQMLFLNNNQKEISKEYITELINQFFYSLDSFILKESAPDLSSISDCHTDLRELAQTNISLFYEMFSYNGKGYSDLGLEESCLFIKQKYIQVLYEVKLDSDGNTINNDENEVIRFLNLNKFYTGLCLPMKCLSALEQLHNGNIPNTLFTYAETNYFLKNISFLYPQLKLSLSTYLWFSILIYIIIAYLILKVLLTIIRNTCLSSGPKLNARVQEGRLNLLEEEDNDNNNMINLDDNLDDDKYKHKKPSRKKRRTECNSIFSVYSPASFYINLDKGLVASKYKNESMTTQIINFFDFFNNIHILTILKSKYYNDKQISIFAFFRFILMFFITYNHNFFTMTKIPGKDFLNSDFYKSFLFFSIKLSIHALSIWIVVDAATFAFKFISSVKVEINKKKECSVSIVFILKWWLYTIPKIILFLFIFFFFHVFMDYYKVFFNTGTMFELYLHNFQDRPCTFRPWEIFIPFFISYKDANRGNAYCYRFVYVYLNEFYCFILMTIYFYIILKIRSKLVDYVFLGIVVLNMILTCLSIPFTSMIYDVNNVIGQNFTDKYTHLTLSFYLMGVFVGMGYFYFYDAVSKDSLCDNYSYYPFCYCLTLVTSLDTLRIRWKKVLLWSCFIILFIDSMSYLFIRLTNETTQHSLCFPMNTFINIYDQYDKILFSLIFSFILILLLLFPKDTALKHVIASNIFFPFSRIGTAFLCMSNTLIYIAYTQFIIQLKLSYQNLFFMTIGLFVIISACSLLITLMFELPFRILFKLLVRWINRRDKPILDDQIMLDQINQSMRILEDED